MQAWRDLSIAGSFSLLGAFRCWELSVATAKESSHQAPTIPTPVAARRKPSTYLCSDEKAGSKGDFSHIEIEYVSGSKTSYCTEFIEPKTRVTVRTLLRVILIAFSTLISSPCIFETCYTGSD